MKRRGVRKFPSPSQRAGSGEENEGNGVSLLFFCVIAGDAASWQLALALALAFVSLLSSLGTVRSFQCCAFRITWLIFAQLPGEKESKGETERENTHSILTVCVAKKLLLAN